MVPKKKKKRKKNANLTQLTYHNHDNLIHSRSDRIFANKNQKILPRNTIPNTFLDHEAVLLTLQIQKQKPHGKGYWKLNTPY